MKLIYGIKDKPKFSQRIVFAFQQVLAIMAATLAVPAVINEATGSAMDPAAALCGAGLGTIVYLLFTRSKSPVFLGSSFAFIGSMCAAFGGAATMALGYLGLILGAVLAGLVYVILAIFARTLGTDWLNKLMPPVVIGPTVAIIGLSLAPNAIADLLKSGVHEQVMQYSIELRSGIPHIVESLVDTATGSVHVCLVCGLITLLTTVLFATYGKKMSRLIPFILGILAGYLCACIFYVIGNITGNDMLKVISFQPFADCFSTVSLASFVSVPRFTFLQAKGAFSELNFGYFITLLTAYVPVAFVVFAEHIADHKNLSSIVEKDLLKEPGLHRTLLGDGVGSMAGAVFGGCPNTTYGESIGCVAITGNASIITIWYAAVLCILISFLSPFIAFLESIPSCVMGGVCIALYGFIAVSGLKMLQNVDLNENRNLFTASVILITGVGGLIVKVGAVEIRTVACALILGILVNKLLSRKKQV
ncbi:MAG: uracil-xanthine permease [Oscillospiraceae bacterium]|nr:uracil-xanthine permease [Oscillospiraceae bacterium]